MDLGFNEKLLPPAMSVFASARSSAELLAMLLKSQGGEAIPEHLGFWRTHEDAVLFNHPDGLVEFQGVPLLARQKYRFIAHQRAYYTALNGQELARGCLIEGASNMGTHMAGATPHVLGVHATFWRKDFDMPDTESGLLFYRYQMDAAARDSDGSVDRLDEVYVLCYQPVGAPVQNVLFPHLTDVDRLDSGITGISAHQDVFPLLAYQLHYTAIALESRFPGWRHGSLSDSLLVTKDEDDVSLYGWHIPGILDAEYARVDTGYTALLRNWPLMSRRSEGTGGSLTNLAALLRVLLHRMLRDASITGEGVLVEAAEDADVLNRNKEHEVTKVATTRFASLKGTGRAFSEAVLNFLSLYFEVGKHVTYDVKRRIPGFLQTEGGTTDLTDAEGNAVLRSLLKEAQLYKDCSMIDYGRPKASEFGEADHVWSADMDVYTGAGYEVHDDAVTEELPAREPGYVMRRKGPAFVVDAEHAGSVMYLA